MNTKLETATLEKLNDLSLLFNEYMVFYKQKSNVATYAEFLKERMQNKEAIIYIAYAEDNDNLFVPAGFVLNYFSFSSVSQGKTIILNDLFVLPEFRKNGIAEQLIAKSIDLAKTTRAIRVELGTEKNNFNAQKLYERIGFIKDTSFYNYSYSIH